MFVVFMALWVLFNARITTEILIWGAGISAVLYVFCITQLQITPKKEWNFIKKTPQWFSYLGLLLVEIFRSNLAVTRMVFSSKKEIHPQLITFKTPLKSNMLRTILCDSITITPGTLTVYAEGDQITVHCLDTSFAEGIEDTEFQKRLCRISGDCKKEEEAKC